MAWDPINDTELNPGYPVLKHMRQAWNSLLWLYGQLGTLAAGGVQNGSFEVNSDGNAIPDGWTWSAYPGGTLALDTTTPAHGATGIAITHPGGAGNGGGALTSDYIICSELMPIYLGWIHRASVAGMKNIVNVRFYTAGKAYISSTTLYSSTANPTASTYYVTGFTPVAGARFYKVEIIGGYTDTNVAGTAYWDAVGEVGFGVFIPTRTTSIEIAENYADYSSGYSDKGSTTLTLTTATNLPTVFSFVGSVHVFSVNPQAQVAYIRFRIGTDYSNEYTTTNSVYENHTFTLTTTPTTYNPTIYMQLAMLEAGAKTYGKVTAGTATYKVNI